MSVVQFRGKGGRFFGEIDVLAGLTLVSALITLMLLIVTSGEEGWCRIVPFLDRCMQSDGSANSAIVYSLRIVLTVSTIVLFAVAIIRISISFFKSLHVATRAWFPISRLTRAKLIDEIRSFPNTSSESFEQQLAQARDDENKLKMANRLGLIRNSEILEHDWPPIEGHLKEHVSIGDVASQRVVEYQKALERLKSALGRQNIRRLRIFLSAVHPGILYCAEAVRTDAGNEGLITVSANTHTGPAAVNEAFHSERQDKRVERESLVLIAPLSAFSTFDSGAESEPISSKFKPVSCLVRELQDLLVVTSPDNVNLRKGTLFVYNNSTAEECLARLPQPLVAPSGDLNICLVESFDDYKMLLMGKVNTQGDKLRQGDAIITWPPLTEYYQGKAVGSSLYLSKAEYEGETGDRYSRIMLYVSNEVFETPDQSEITWAFIDCLTRRFLVESGRSRSFSFAWWEIFLKVAISRFFGILLFFWRAQKKRDFFSDHESNFRKIVK